jgi:ATP-dependent helicase HrpB
MPQVSTELPIESVLPELKQALATRNSAVLVAPPGAGKTTRVPLELLAESWTRGGKIIVLEPRRLAARAAAERMAFLLGERTGETVGIRARLQSRIGPHTRIEVVTEGVFARMIVDDPALEGVAAVVFDEFHERSLDADLGLALALDAQAGLREDLRILVMSATLDGARVARLLKNATVVESEGRAFPVETRHRSRDARAPIEDEVARVVMEAFRAEGGSMLVFLPGQREILRTAERLRERVSDPHIDIAPLFGAMERGAQDLAVSPPKSGRRKIVLATSIAETSLTIEGVRVVVDSGLARVPRFEPDLGLTRLVTERVSRAAADQRRGRAGRTEPGVCYRLWEEAATGALEAYSRPEILSADLSPLMLDLALWGVRDPVSLNWLDPPPAPAVVEARKLLQSLGALDGEGAITAMGRAMRALALPPRLSRMVIEAAREGEAQTAAAVAAVLVERGMGGDGADISERIERFRRDRSQRATAMQRLADGWAANAARETVAKAQAGIDPHLAGSLLALAYPDRIAKARGKPGEFLMANGRAAALEPHDRLARETFLAVAEIAGRAGAARILAAAAMTPEEVEARAGAAIGSVEETVFDRASASVKSRRLRRLGAIVLNERPQPVAGPEAARVLVQGIVALGVARLPWSKAQLQMRDRVSFVRAAHAGEAGNPWPDIGDTALAADAGEWLAPFIEGRSSLAAITPDDLDAALRALVPWDLARRLDEEAPTHFEAPTGSRVALDYEAEGGAGAGDPRARTFRPLHASFRGGRARAVDAAPAVARAPADPDYEGSARFLERLLVGREDGNEGPLSASRLARRPGGSVSDDTRETPGNMMIVRDATAGDLAAIRGIYAHHVLHGTGTFEEEPPDTEEMVRRFAAVLANGLPWIVAEIDGAVAGYAYAQRYHARSAWRHTLEDSVYVAPDRARGGVGKALLTELLARCSALGYREMIAVIGDSGNAGSTGLHARAGFERAGLLRDVGLKFGKRLDVVLMQKTLG